MRSNEYLFYLNSEPEYGHGDVGESISLPLQNEEITFTMKDLKIERKINLLPNSYEFIVVNQEVFEKLKSTVEGYELNLHLINVADWKNSNNAVNQLKEQFTADNQAASAMDYPDMQDTSEDDLFRVASKIGDYHLNKATNGMMFYVTTFLSIMFFFGTFVLLYLNLFSEVETEKVKYRKLNKIGMASKEIKSERNKGISDDILRPNRVRNDTGLFVSCNFINRCWWNHEKPRYFNALPADCRNIPCHPGGGLLLCQEENVIAVDQLKKLKPLFKKEGGLFLNKKV